MTGADNDIFTVMRLPNPSCTTTIFILIILYIANHFGFVNTFLEPKSNTLFFIPSFDIISI
jgi:hypothetical protein